MYVLTNTNHAIARYHAVVKVENRDKKLFLKCDTIGPDELLVNGYMISCPGELFIKDCVRTTRRNCVRTILEFAYELFINDCV